jgi:hypothetical protein
VSANKKNGYELFNFEILDSVKPSINGKSTYQRLLIRRIPPKGEKVISVCRICEDYMAENGIEKDLNECAKCELEFVIGDMRYTEEAERETGN